MKNASTEEADEKLFWTIFSFFCLFLVCFDSFLILL